MTSKSLDELFDEMLHRVNLYVEKGADGFWLRVNGDSADEADVCLIALCNQLPLNGPYPEQDEAIHTGYRWMDHLGMSGMVHTDGDDI